MPKGGDNRILPPVFQEMPVDESKRVGRPGLPFFAFSKDANYLGIGLSRSTKTISERRVESRPGVSSSDELQRKATHSDITRVLSPHGTFQIYLSSI